MSAGLQLSSSEQKTIKYVFPEATFCISVYLRPIGFMAHNFV